MEADANAARETREVVVFVHGTGAGKPNPANAHWWEAPHSVFAKELQRALGDKFIVAEPFCWTGNNSESDRRLAGRQLLKRLRKEHESHHRYHLIGHSHGGSVIWHALVHSIGIRKKPLTGLVTWTTVGTPFLTFRPDYAYWWLFLTTLVAVGACIGTAPHLWDALLDHDVVINAASRASRIALPGTMGPILSCRPYFGLVRGTARTGDGSLRPIMARYSPVADRSARVPVPMAGHLACGGRTNWRIGRHYRSCTEPYLSERCNRDSDR